MKHKSALVFLIILAVTFSVQQAYASTAADLDYGIMIENADFIIVGNVTRIQNDTYTYVTIAIEDFVTNTQNMSQITITPLGESFRVQVRSQEIPSRLVRMCLYSSRRSAHTTVC